MKRVAITLLIFFRPKGNSCFSSNILRSTSDPWKVMGTNKPKPHVWNDSENLECQISEACQLYGIDSLECARDKKAVENECSDAVSIISEDSSKDEVTPQDRINSKLYIV